MAVVADTQQAVAILHGIQDRLEDSGDVALSHQVAVMIKLLDSPSFKQLLNLQQAVRQLKDHISTTPPGKQTDFDFSPEGELVLPHEEPIEDSEPEPESPGANHPFAFENVTFQPDEETITPSVAPEAASAPTIPGESALQLIPITDERLKELAFNRELVAIDLFKPENGGLGFTVVGLNSKTHGDLGIFVQKIQPGSVAASDGRLHESDQILVINDQILHAGVSHKDAIAMLHKIKGPVYLIIARGDFDLPPPSELQPMDAVQPEEKIEEQEEEVISDGMEEMESSPEIRTIELANDGHGLGFGIVGVHNTGIVVKTIVKGGVADRDGQLESGDIILQIGDTRLEGMNSTQVANVLRQSGNNVRLTVVKKGISVPPQQLKVHPLEEPKVEKVEETKEEEAPPLPVTSPPPDVAVDTPKIDLDIFEVDLQKTSQGLGLSIAGYEENRPDGVEAGIFVKGIADGSAAALSQKIKVGDQIIEVDGQPVNGFGNRQAVELLRRTGSLVHLKLARRKTKRTKSVDVPVTVPEKQPEEPKKIEPTEEKIEEKKEDAQAEKKDVQVEKEDIQAEEEESKPEKDEEEEMKKDGEDDNEEDETDGGRFEERIEAAAGAALMASLVMDEKKDEEPAKEEEEKTEAASTHRQADIVYPKNSPAMASRKDPTVQIALWQSILGPEVTILISDVEKDGSLGIILEGRVDIDENGQEIQPRHYISTVVPDGPVGRQGQLAPGDELLEVNGIRLYGRNHHEVVDILRGLPPKVHLICGRHAKPPVVVDADVPAEKEAPVEIVVPEVVTQVESSAPVIQEAAVEVKEAVEEREEEEAVPAEETPTVASADSVSVHSDTPSGMSHESLMGVSVWSDQVQLVTLLKEDQGLGFSILDYQDPLKPESNVILIRSLVDGGIAEQDGRLIPGDRLMSVNDINLENANLEEAVEAVRGAARGYVKIGVAKPLPSSIIEEQREALAQQAKEDEDKRRSLEREAPVHATSTSMAYAAALGGRANPPDLLADGPPQPAPRKSLTNSPPPEPSHPAPVLPAPVVVSSASVSLKQRPAYVELPESLEKTLVLRKAHSGLGMTVGADQANGAIVKSILRGGSVHEDGTLAVGDYITAINGDSTRNMSNTNIRGLMRKCFLGGSEISITYISATDAAAYRDQLAESITAASRGSDDEEMWQDIRVVEVHREQGKSLGISILGGRVGQGLIDGIFIKHVLEDSPAGKTGDLKTGDRILEVNDCDLREATHDQAVAIIKNAPNPVKFKVQSLSPELQPSYLSELDDEPYQATMIMSLDGDQEKSDSDDVDENTKETSSSVGSVSESEDEYGYTHKKIAERYRDLPGEYLIFEIQKTSKSVGLSLSGNKDGNIMSAFVVGIHPESPAAKEGSIMVADELMEINGIIVFGHTHRDASSIIGEMPEGPLKLVIRRRPEAVNELAVPYLETTPVSQVPVALRKPSGIVVDLTDGGDLQEESGEVDFSSFPNVHTIALQKGPTGLGFFIYERKDFADRPGIFVKEITHGGAAGQEGSLQVDDQILAVDGLPLIGLSKMSAISVLKGTRGKVELTVSSAKARVTSFNPYLMTSVSIEESIGDDDETDGGPAPTEMKSILKTSVKDEMATREDSTDLESGPLVAAILPKTQSSIIIDRGSKSLGIRIAGGSDTDIPMITIDEVHSAGAAAKDGRLKPGDQILAVNGVQLNDVTHDEALQVFRDIPPLVPMIVFRVESDASSTETWEEETIELIKREGQGLGLSIVGKKNDRGVFISDIVIGGVAFRDGRLRRGDRLLAVGGQDVINVSKDQVAPMLRNAVGTVVLKVGRLTAEAAAEPSMEARLPTPSEEARAQKEESLLSELINDPQLDHAGGESGYSQDEEQEEDDDEDEEVNDPGAPIQTVVLERGPDGLGFSIVGGFGSPHGNLPIYIKTVFDRGAAAKSKVLKRGDQIVEVNGINLSGASHKEAVSVLKQVSGTVELKIISR